MGEERTCALPIVGKAIFPPGKEEQRANDTGEFRLFLSLSLVTWKTRDAISTGKTEQRCGERFLVASSRVPQVCGLSSVTQCNQSGAGSSVSARKLTHVCAALTLVSMKKKQKTYGETGQTTQE